MADNPYLKNKFSFYKRPIMNVIPSNSITIYDLIDSVENNYKEETSELRGLPKKKRGAYKKLNFDYVSISGEFKKRNEAELIKHSGFIVIDIDNVESPDQIKKTIQEKCEYYMVAFTSPGGVGVKVVFQIDPEKYSQAEWYQGYSKYLIELLKLPDQKIDGSCKDVSRACFLGNDPELIINPKLLEI